MAETSIEQLMQTAVQHHKAGQLTQAEAIYRQVLASQPNLHDALNLLGALAYQTGHPDEAEQLMRRAIAFTPNNALSQYNLGIVMHSKQKLREAEHCFRRAIALAPQLADPYHNLAIVLRALRNIPEAIHCATRAVAINPNHADAYHTLGGALEDSGRKEQAIACYRKALSLKPDSQTFRFDLAAATGETVGSSPRESVVKLFDKYAIGFDKHLVDVLGYRVPQEMLAVVREIEPRQQLDVLDLGCGTGLCGVQFRSMAKSLIGVDLSPKMIDAARRRKLYDQLHVEDIAVFLRDRREQFDLVLAADVFVYVGDLAETFTLIAQALRPGGLFVFSVEVHEGEGFVLHPTRRFAHSISYLRALGAREGLVEVRMTPAILRKQADQHAAGCLAVLRKAGGS